VISLVPKVYWKVFVNTFSENSSNWKKFINARNSKAQEDIRKNAFNIFCKRCSIYFKANLRKSMVHRCIKNPLQIFLRMTCYFIKRNATICGVQKQMVNTFQCFLWQFRIFSKKFVKTRNFLILFHTSLW
jgi:hypothetical protein